MGWWTRWTHGRWISDGRNIGGWIWLVRFHMPLRWSLGLQVALIYRDVAPTALGLLVPASPIWEIWEI